MKVDSRSWDWDKVEDPFWRRPSADVFFLLHRWKELGFSRVLDLGCGVGRHSLLFARHGFMVTALDLSEAGLHETASSAARGGYAVQTVHSDLKSLPFADRSFDAVLAYHSIYHVDSQGMPLAISETQRVLKPGGEIFITLISKNTPSFTDPATAVVDANVRLKKEEDGNLSPHFYVDRSEIPSLLQGMEILQLRQIEDIFGDMSSWHYIVHARKP